MLDLEDFFKSDTMLKVSIIISIVLLIALILGSVISYLVLRKKGKTTVITTKDITYGAICLACSFALSFIGIKFPQAGTITPASSLPIMIYCYYFGFKKSLVVCTAYTVLQFLQSPSIVHPMSLVLDYVIPYMALIFFGVFAKKKTDTIDTAASAGVQIKSNYKFFIGAACYIIVRYFSHSLSGIIFYGDYAQWGLASVPYAFVYNLYFIADAAIAIIAGIALLSSKTFNRFMAVSCNTLQNSNATGKND